MNRSTTGLSELIQPIQAVPMAVFPTLNSLREVYEYAETLLPITHRNAMRAILNIHHNTLLKIIQEQQ